MKVFDVKFTYKNGIVATRTVTAKDDVLAREKAVNQEIKSAKLEPDEQLIDFYCEINFVRDLSE